MTLDDRKINETVDILHNYNTGKIDVNALAEFVCNLQNEKVSWRCFILSPNSITFCNFEVVTG